MGREHIPYQPLFWKEERAINTMLYWREMIFWLMLLLEDYQLKAPFICRP